MLLLLGLSARLWGLFALYRVEAELIAGHRTLSVGDKINICCRVKNDKFLPLIWLEFCLPVPPRGCLEPDDSFARFGDEPDTRDGEALKQGFRRRLSLLLWYRVAEWESAWTAIRRGIYRPGALSLRTGDGFGLTRSRRDIPIPGDPAIVIYPRLVPVNSAGLLRTVWMGETGKKGYLDDPTVIRGERDYQAGDSWKRIDWRMAARHEELQVKLFETILPRSIHFVLDVASFANESQENDEFEDMLSVVASLIIRLSRDGVRCGLSVPQTAASPNCDFFPDDLSVGLNDLLFQFAILEGEGATELFNDNAIADYQHRAGQVCFVTSGSGRLTCRMLLERLELRALTVLALNEPSGAELWADCRFLRIDDLRL